MYDLGRTLRPARFSKIGLRYLKIGDGGVT